MLVTDILLEPPTRHELNGEPKDDTPYYLTTPEGKRARHTRVSTLVENLDRNERLHAHQLRELAFGIGLHDDLWHLANSHRDYRGADRPVYEQLVKDAQVRAASNGRANIGTGLHRYLEDLNRGLPLTAFPPKTHPHLTAYRTTIARYPITINTKWMEQTVILDQHRVAGKLDNIATIEQPLTIKLDTGRTVELDTGTDVVADLKTGSWVAPIKWSAQVAGYAGHTATWHKDDNHPHGGVRGDKIPGISRTAGLLIHLDATIPDNGQPECHLYWIDLDRGWDLFTLAYERHLYNPIEKQLLTRWADHEPTVFETAAEQWVRERLAALPPPAAADLKQIWPLRDPDGQPVRYDHPTPEQTEAVLAALDNIEARHQLPLTAPPATGGAAKPKQTPRSTNK